MLTELACYNQDSTYKEILEAIFVASQKKLDSVAIPSGFMGRVNDFLDDQKFSAAIDFPYGLSSTSVRVHEIIIAIRQGASYIDLVLNNSYVKEENWKKIRKDLKDCLSVCSSHNVEMRVILEYRLFPIKTVLLICDLLAEIGVYNVINSTGFVVDNISDNALISYEIQRKTGCLVTSCVMACNKSHLKTFHDMKIHGIRIMSSKVVDSII